MYIFPSMMQIVSISVVVTIFIFRLTMQFYQGISLQLYLNLTQECNTCILFSKPTACKFNQFQGYRKNLPIFRSYNTHKLYYAYKVIQFLEVQSCLLNKKSRIDSCDIKRIFNSHLILPSSVVDQLWTQNSDFAR